MPPDDDAPPPRPSTSATLRTAGNAVALGVAEVTGKVFTLGYTIVATRVLTPEEFGQFAFALALALLFVVVPKWGFGPDLIRRGSGARDRLDDLLSASLVVTIGLGAVTFTVVGLVAGASRSTRDGAVVIGLMLVAALLDACADRMRAGAAALERQREAAVALVANRIATGVLVVALLLAGTGVVGMGAGYLMGSVIDVGMTTRVVRRLGLHPRLRGVGRDTTALVVRGSWVAGLSAVTAMVLFRVDQVIIEALLGSAALAAYAVAYRLLETVLFLSWSLSRAVLPVLATATEPWRIRRGLTEGVAVLAAVYVPFAVVALVEPDASIALVFGDQYAEQAGPVLQWLAPSPLLFGVAYMAAQVLLAQRRDGWALTANASATILNVVGNLLLVPRYGIAAAAAVTSATLAVRALVAVGATGLAHAGRGVVGAVASAAAGGVVLAGVLALLGGPVLLQLLAGGLAYAGAWWAVTRWRAPEHLEVVRGVASRLRR